MKKNKQNLTKISLRKADFSDIKFLWYLRNQPDVYRYFRQAKKVSWPEHIKWVLPIISGKGNKDIYIIQKESLSVGQIRFDHKQGGEAVISIAVLKEFRGKGAGIEGFKEAVRLLKKEKKIKIIIAEVHKDNAVSQKFFEKLNFKLKSKKGNWLKYILKL